MNNEETIVPEIINEPVTPPEGETAEQKLERLTETNRKLYERAKDAEAKAKEYKAKISLSTPATPKIDEDIMADVKDLKSFKKMFELGQKNKLSPDETEKLIRYSGTVNKDPNEALKDEDFKDILEVGRKRSRIANAIPSSSNRTTSVEGKSFKDMTPEERSKNWGKIVKPE